MIARRSLRLRVLAVGLSGVLLSALLASVGLRAAFREQAEEALVTELQADLRYLTRSLQTVEGQVVLRPVVLPDPRFQEPLSGLYWQIVDDSAGVSARSESLVTFEMDLPADVLPIGEVHHHAVAGPGNSTLLVVERRITTSIAGKTGYRFAVAFDRRLVDEQADDFMAAILPSLGLLALGLMAAALLQAGLILAPLKRVRKALSEVRLGQRSRLAGALPGELDELAQEFDILLEAGERSIRRTREQAADLAHGLRTPMAVLLARADDAMQAGQHSLASSIREVVRHVEYRAARELARASLLGPRTGRTPAVDAGLVVSRVMAALSRTTDARMLSWDCEVPTNMPVRMDEHDVTDMLGAVLDNAAKWAASSIRINGRAEPGWVVLSLDDDGPGIAPQDRHRALVRGERLGASAGGTGLGLAIADEIARAYGGSIQLDDSPLGGLRVVLRLPVVLDHGQGRP